MKDLDELLAVDYNSTTLNLLLDNAADQMMTKILLIRILSHLENKDIETIENEVNERVPKLRKQIVDDLRKILKNK